MELNTTFYQENRKKFAEKMAENSIAVFFSGKPVIRSGDDEYPFSVDNNFYYLTGLREPEVILVIDKDAHHTVSEHLFLRQPDPEKEKWYGKMLSFEEAASVSGILHVDRPESFKDYIARRQPGTVYTDGWMPDHQKSILSGLLSSLSEKTVQKDSSAMLQEMRNIKQPPEIEMIKKAIGITAKGIKLVSECIKPGTKEYELQALFEYVIAVAGAEGTAFKTIVASGKNATVLHYDTNRDRIKAGDFILFDLGARYRGYNADISRTMLCGAPASSDQEVIWQTVRETEKAMISLYQPGTAMKTIQKATEEILRERLSQRRFVSKNFDIKSVYFHGIGHPLGLDTHDLGRQPDLVLRPGMVFTCEPGLYFADKGIGVRIEDDILITENGPVNLSAEIPIVMS